MSKKAYTRPMLRDLYGQMGVIDPAEKARIVDNVDNFLAFLYRQEIGTMVDIGMFRVLVLGDGVLSVRLLDDVMVERTKEAFL